MKTFCVVETEIGFIGLAGEDGKLTDSTLPKPSREAAVGELEHALDSETVDDCASFSTLPELLMRYARGKRVDFSKVPVDIRGMGEFHKAVILACQQIPYGQLVTYRELAGMAGSERAARAAGGAMARNPIPIIAPCHRVVASGGIGGFGAGLEWKRTLLRLEGVDI